MTALAFSASAALALVAAAAAALAWRRLHARLGRVARASHELRGALSAMGLALSRMEASPDGEPWRRSVEALRAQHERARLAASDLDATGSDSPEAEAEARTFVDLEVLVRRCVRAWAAAHGRWRIVLDWRAGRPTIWGRAGRLGQALDNLIANALEHGAGPVTIVARLTTTAVTVTVLDRGEGLRHSLDRPARASWSARRGHGLVIARRAIDEHGGQMRLVRESRGAGVQVILPLAHGAPGSGAPGTVLPAAGQPGVARPA